MEATLARGARQWFRRVARAIVPGKPSPPSPNFVIDGLIRPVEFNALRNLGDVWVDRFELKADRLEVWIDEHVPDWRNRFRCARHKKLIEFFASSTLLRPGPEDCLLDVAGGVDSYIGRVASRYRYLHDLCIRPAVRERAGPAVKFLESDAAAIPLPDGSVDAISCHHSFEHFQRDSDSGFIDEVQRLLAPGGRCCIVPIFLADWYVEVTNERTFAKQFDKGSRLVIDPTATIAGHWSGGYARIYDVRAFRERVVDRIDTDRFEVGLLELSLEGRGVPDLTLDCHRTITAINHPYRALLISRKSSNATDRSLEPDATSRDERSHRS
jgi:SAM-dependent methyltransferase